LADKAGILDLAAFEQRLRDSFEQWLFPPTMHDAKVVADQAREICRVGAVFLKQLEKLRGLKRYDPERLKGFNPELSTTDLGGRLRDFNPELAFVLTRGAFDNLDDVRSTVGNYLDQLRGYQFDVTGRSTREGNPVLGDFIFSLELAALRAGGNFTLDK